MTDRAPTNIDISPSATAGGVTEAQPGGPVTSKSWEALPDLLDTIHCETYSFFTASYAAPWALSFSGQGEVFSYELREGSAIIEIAGAEFVLEVGDLCLIPHGKPHKLYSGAESKGAAIGHAICRVDVQRANPLLKLLPFALIFRAEDGALVSWMRTMAGFIEDLRNSTDPGDQAILRRMTEAAIIRAMRVCRAPSSPPPSPKPWARHRRNIFWGCGWPLRRICFGQARCLCRMWPGVWDTRMKAPSDGRSNAISAYRRSISAPARWSAISGPKPERPAGSCAIRRAFDLAGGPRRRRFEGRSVYPLRLAFAVWMPWNTAEALPAPT
jgi:hypothetical protein